jgi:hypothetical protein
MPPSLRKCNQKMIHLLAAYAVNFKPKRLKHCQSFAIEDFEATWEGQHEMQKSNYPA